jgi:putative ABC transport system permease protein
MMGVVWRKVWRDLAHNKVRSLLVTLSTGVGLFALGIVFGMRGAVRAWLAEDYRIAVPAHVNFWPSPFDQDVVELIRREPNIAEVEGRMSYAIRWKLEGETDWRDGMLIARVAYDAQRIDRVDLADGQWPARRTLAVERQSSRHFGVPLGAVVAVEYEGCRRNLSVTGILRAHNEAPPQFGGPALLYATPDTVAWLTGREGLTTLDVRLASFSDEHLDEAVERIHDRMERMGLPIHNTVSQGTDAHILQDQVNAALFLLIGLGVLALGLSGFLIANTTHAIIAQQVWQIGVMKVLGATFGHVARVYLATALIYGGLALLPAMPLAAVAAHWLASPILDLFNVAAGPFRVTPTAVGIQVTVGLTVPLFATLIPTMGGARISPHQAISRYGLGTGFGRSWLDRRIGAIHCLPRPAALCLRNTFRRKTRVALMVSTLVLCGVMFIVTMSIRSSLDRTIEMRVQDFGDDVMVQLKRPYPTAQVVSVTERVTGVARVEVWSGSGRTARLASGKERYVYLWALPPASALFRPRIISGRWLHPDDDRAIAFSSKIAADEGVQVGDEIVLTFDKRESVWTVVGLIVNSSHAYRACFVPFDAFTRATRSADRGWNVRIQGAWHDVENQQALIRRLRTAYTAANISINSLQSIAEMKEQSRSMFDLLAYLMLTMTALAAAVGGIGLMSTMTIHVVERRREIGVMRAVGATSPAIAGIFIGEGVLLGILSWSFAVPISYPAARAISNAVGYPFMGAPLDFCYSMAGAVLWLAIVAALSALSSLWPALRATRVSVQEALAYE